MSKNSIIAIMYYLFGVITKIELRRHIGPENAELVKHGYYCRNCKLFVYAYTRNTRVKAKDYGILPKDVATLKNVASSLQIDSKCRALTLAEMESNEAFLVSELKPYIGRFVTKKMLFLIRNFNLPRDDIESDLMIAALFAFHKRYPFFDSELYALNVCKSAIHNAGMDLIVKYSSQKRQRLHQIENGCFEQLHVDVSTLCDLEAPQPFECRYQDERRALRELETKIPARASKFISLARGDFDRAFSEYLGVDNNSTVADDSYQSYLKSVCDYLKINRTKRKKLLESIRRHL